MEPDTTQAGSNYIATWRCGKCCEECGKSHVWQAEIGQRTSASGRNCPICSRHKVCSCQLLATLRPDLMLEWADGNSLDPQTLGCYSHQKALWTCSKCSEHGSWLAAIGHRAQPRATGCPTCAYEKTADPRMREGFLGISFLRSVPSSSLSLGVCTTLKGSHLAAGGSSGGGALKPRTGHQIARMSIVGKPV
jgi:hypothetical protein